MVSWWVLWIWVPWIPALMGWGITSSAVGYMTYRLRKG